ncbi:hypothetical protein NG895_01260 [Aeoliella sp. ICT_H6.2]|uniref:Secreted protein n=1 Tax=Aeoliella straminimaris TaxID=2954799 RepID=A0A9X2F5G4_9BACT|nr:hypothetical protein [Aeoliella straminimaris]MCO6042525.1 hypothetical protein [Aeoliella straminimaris]
MRFSRVPLRYALLLLLAWPGPVPVMHSHNQSDWESGQFERHISLYHGVQEDGTDDPDEPHLHWVLYCVAIDEARLAEHPPCVMDNTQQTNVQRQQLILGDMATSLVGFRSATCSKSRSQHHRDLCDGTSLSRSGLAFHQHFCIWTC